MNNILITSAGRRVELVNSFKQELKQSFPDALLITSDMNPEMSAACQISDVSLNTPPLKSENYIEYLFEICIEHKVGIVLPTIDTELLVLAEAKEKFLKAGINIIVSEIEFVKTCRNKKKSSKFFNKIGVDTPDLFAKENLLFPCFVKPYDGSSSVGSSIIYSEDQLTKEILSNNKLMFMEYLDSKFTEYTIDAYYDRQGVLKCFVPRERIEVRAGEVSKAVTRKNKFYKYLKPVLEKIEGARGCLAIQFFVDLNKENYKAIEINPRFGGGFPLSLRSGANYPQWIVREYLMEEELTFHESWTEDLLMLRYDTEIIKKYHDDSK